MSGANSFKFVLLPPQSDTTRDWAKRLAKIVSEARVLVIGGGSVRQAVVRRCSPWFIVISKKLTLAGIFSTSCLSSPAVVRYNPP